MTTSTGEFPAPAGLAEVAAAWSRRRVARRVPAHSPQQVLLHVMSAVLDPSWAPDRAAVRLVAQEQNPSLLRQARARLRAVSRGRTSLIQARALATLNLAIFHLDSNAGTDIGSALSGPGAGGWGKGT